MAGIEKICEMSGHHPGGIMWSYKRNQLQIMPEYRKLFRGAKHELRIKVEGEYLNYSMDLSTVKRKLKRLLRCKELNIV